MCTGGGDDGIGDCGGEDGCIGDCVGEDGCIGDCVTGLGEKGWLGSAVVYEAESSSIITTSFFPLEASLRLFLRF